MLETLLDDAPLLLEVLWQSTFWLVLALAAARWRAARPDQAHAILCSGVVAAIATPALTALCRTSGWALFAPLVRGAGLSGAATPLPALGEIRLAPAATWLTAALAAWAAVSLFMLLRLVLALAHSRRILAGALPLERDDAGGLALEAASRSGTAAVPRLLSSSDVACPLIWCWSRTPCILLPARLAESMAPAPLLAVACHELAHWQRRDHFSALACELAACLMPWHPLMWRARGRLAQLAEEACDAHVIAGGASRTAFADLLLAFVPERRRILALAALSTRAGLARRIERILHAPVVRQRWSRRAAALLAATVLVVTAAAALAHRRPLDAAPPDAAAPGPTEFALEATPVGMIDGQPIVRATPSELDLGEAEPGTANSGKVWLVNTGPVPMNIVSAKGTCGCTSVAASLPAILAPGRTMELGITMVAPKTPGERKTKNVRIDVEGQPTLEVPVSVRAAGP